MRTGNRRRAVVLMVGVGLCAGSTSAFGRVDGALGVVAEPAVRGEQRFVGPAPTYPAGRCDEHTGGLALEPGELPTAVEQIGVSVEGRPIWAEHWGPTTGPQLLVVGQTHGYECTPLVFTRMARRLGPASPAGIWLIPTLNPDGYAAFVRHNANGVDLNADGFAQGQPETQALMRLTAALRPALTVHVHSPNSFVGWYGSAISSSAAAAVAGAAGLRLATSGARRGTNWFLWQGQVREWPEGGTILIEANPLVWWEAVGAAGRGPTGSLADAERRASAALLAAATVVAGPPR